MPSLADSDIKKQTPRNLASNGVTFVTTFIVGMWMVPYLRGHLGSEGYGLIPLALGVISYVALLVESLNRSVGRFLTLDIQRRDDDAALRTFNTSVRLLLGIIALHVPVMAVCAWLSVRYLDIPSELVSDAFRMFLYMFGSFFVSLFSAVFRTPLDAYNRLDLRRLIEVARLLTRAGLIVVLFTWQGPSLTRVGMAGFVASIVELLLSMFFCRRLTPQLVVRRGFYDTACGRDMLSMGKWIILQTAGALLLMKIDLIIVNLKGGAAMTGDYAPCQLVAEMTRNITGVMAGVIWPVIMLGYAREQWDRLTRVLHLSVRALGAVVAIPVGIACGLSRPFLAVWLGSDYAAFAPLLVLLLFHLPLTLSVSPLYTAHSAYNRVRTPAMFFCGLAAFHVLLAMVLASSRLGAMYGVAVAAAVSWTIKDLLFIPCYTTHIMKHRWYAYLGDLLRVATFLVAIAGASYIVHTWFALTSWTRLFAAGAALGGAALPAVWFFLLAPNERALCRQMLLAQRTGRAPVELPPPPEH